MCEISHDPICVWEVHSRGRYLLKAWPRRNAASAQPTEASLSRGPGRKKKSTTLRGLSGHRNAPPRVYLSVLHCCTREEHRGASVRGRQRGCLVCTYADGCGLFSVHLFTVLHVCIRLEMWQQTNYEGRMNVSCMWLCFALHA